MAATTSSPYDVLEHLRAAFLTFDIDTLYSSWPAHKPPQDLHFIKEMKKARNQWVRTVLSLKTTHSAFSSLLPALTHHPSTCMSCDIFTALQDSDDYLPPVKGLLNASTDQKWHTPN